MRKNASLKLVEKAVKGNREAFGELIMMHQEYLYKLAYMYTKNEQDALDIAGEAVCKGAGPWGPCGSRTILTPG